MENWWADFPWRLIQTNLREIDMQDMDAKAYARCMKDMHATIAMINTAGIIASYKTNLPFHFQSQFLDGDQLDEIIAACHHEGIRVVARTDFSKVRRPLYEHHPEWACVYTGGAIEDYNGDVHCCLNGAYQQVYALKIIEETLQKLDIDGIFFNMDGYITHNYSHEHLGICQCANCKRLFRAFAGTDLPEREDMQDQVFRKYQIFKNRTLTEYKKRVVETIQRIRPDLAINQNTIDGEGFARQESNTEIDRPLPHWQYSGSANTRWVVTSWPHLTPSNTTVDFIGFYYRHVAVSPAQQELRLWQDLANCGGLDYYLMGRLDNHRDRSGFERVKRVFRFHADHFENTYRGLRPDSSLLLVTGRDENEYRGWFRMLIEGHFLFDVVTLDRATSLDLSTYQAVILPDTRYMDDGTATALDAFVDQGGVVIASGEAALYDPDYEARDACALESLGISEVREIRRDVRSAVLEVMDKERFPGMAERDLLCIGDTFIFADYAEGAEGMLRYIPPHNYGPPERCYWSLETDIPGLWINRYGKGMGIHFPWLPGTLFHREGYDNTPVFIRDVLKQVAGLRAVEGNLSPMVEITKSRGDTYILVQLVNGSGHFGTSFYEPVTMTNLEFSIPVEQEPRNIACLNGGKADFSYSAAEKTVKLHVDRLDFFEAIKLIF